jgi:hypothetical protein
MPCRHHVPRVTCVPPTHRFPRPVHHRIPNFVDAEAAAQRLAMLPEFKGARVVKVNPDTPQKMVRRAARPRMLPASRAPHSALRPRWAPPGR